MRKIAILILLTLFAGCGWARINLPAPHYQAPSLAEIRRADAVVIVKLTAEIAPDQQQFDLLRKLPVRRQLVGGTRLQANVIEVLKGAPGKTLDLPTGLTAISAKKDAYLLLLMRGAGQQSWLDTFCYLSDTPAPNSLEDFNELKEKGAAERLGDKEAFIDPLSSPVLYRVRLGLRVLAAPTLTEAVALLHTERAKVAPEKQATIDQLLMELGIDPLAVSTDPKELLDAIRTKKGVDCWREISALVQNGADIISAQDIRDLVAATRDTTGGLQSISPLITFRAMKDPALLAEVGHDTAMPDTLRLDLYARATGLQPNGATGSGELFHITQDPPVFAPGFTRDDVIAYLSPMLTKPLGNSYQEQYRFETALPILAHLQWPGLEAILITQLQQRKGANWSQIEQLVSIMGPYDKALDAAMAVINDGKETDYGVLIGIVNGLVDTGVPRAIAYVRELAKHPHPVMKYAPQSAITTMEQRYGPGYAGSTPDAVAQQRANIAKALFGAEGELQGSPYQLAQHVSFLLDKADQATIEKAWTLFLNEAGRTTRGQCLGDYFSQAANPWVMQQMRTLWETRKGSPLENYTFNAMNTSFAKDAAAREKFLGAVVKDSERAVMTRSTAAQLLANTNSEQAVRALHAALAAAQFKDALAAKFTSLNIPMPPDHKPQLQCEVYLLPDSFLKACANWGDRRAIPWVLEFAKAGMLPDYQVPYTLLQLDPRLEDRQVYEIVVKAACHPEHQQFTTARQKLDDTFARRFFPADTDDEELAAWLKAFDTGALDRAFAKHWLATVTPIVDEEEKVEDRGNAFTEK